MILHALLKLRRRGTTAALEHLEQVEPDLAAYLMETLSALHHDLLALGGPPKRTRRAYRGVESLVLVCIAALRAGHYELWRGSEPDGEDGDPSGALPPGPGPG